MTSTPSLLEDEYSDTRNLMPPYITPRRINALKFKNPKQTGVPLITPLVPKGVKVLMDSIPNLRKLCFVDHDTKKHRFMDHKKYMDTLQETPNTPNKFVAKEQAKGLEQSRILSLLYMPHFGCNVPINTSFQQLLVFFHGGFLWLGNLIHVDVELIASIIGLPFATMDPTPLLKNDKKVVIAMGMKEKYDVVRNTRGFVLSNLVQRCSNPSYFTRCIKTNVLREQLRSGTLHKES